MADTGKQSPLGVNLESSILQDTGFRINPVAEEHMGISKQNSQYTFGKLVSKTCLRLLTWSIHDGYNRGQPGGASPYTLTNATYDNLIRIGSYPNYVNPFLGNSKPVTYYKVDLSNMWCSPSGGTGSIVGGVGQATTGFAISGNTGQGQTATWLPYDTSNPNRSVTQWGYIRLHALQAWYEFNYNGIISGGLATSNPQYKEFCASFMQADGFLSYSNQAIFAIDDSNKFLEGVYSNMPDLMTADIAGVCRSLKEFGADLMALGKSLSLADLQNFGKPSNLLKTIYQNNATTQELTLALLGAGLSEVDIDNIGFGLQSVVTPIQEKQIYGAFLVIAGANLTQILIPLNCSTANLTSLADLLNVRKMFPNSYGALTVPTYNSSPGPTNSKTYYLIYSGNGVNPLLTSPAISTQVGNLSPPGLPQTTDATSQSSTTEVNIQDEPIGFGSNLLNILPTDLAIAAGAFSYSMLQVRNITKADIQIFSQVVYSLETNFGLNLTNGELGKPINQNLVTTGQNIMGLGSGPKGSYTMSDFFGCMSGLPYPWIDAYNQIVALQTRKLFNIYNQLFLAVTWEKAFLIITQNPFYVNVQSYIPPDPLATPPYAGQPRIDTLWYTVTISIGSDGGGYGRGTAPKPLVKIFPNNVRASVVCNFMGTNDTDAASIGGGTFGRVDFAINNGEAYQYGTSVQMSDSPPALNPPAEYIQVEAPPVGTLPVAANGDISRSGRNSTGDIYTTILVTTGEPGWQNPMNDVVQGYINQANEEISYIETNKKTQSRNLLITSNLFGTQLTREQRARFIGLPPVPIPRDPWINIYPTTLYVFTDNLPTYAQNTLPHMHVQTLEAISNVNTVGGQSIVGAMRTERNQARLARVGIQLDNNLASDLAGISQANTTALVLNGTAPVALPTNGILNITTNENFTLPAWVTNYDAAGNLIYPKSPFIYSANTGVTIATGSFVGGSTVTLLSGNSNINIVSTAVPTGPYTSPVNTFTIDTVDRNRTSSNADLLNCKVDTGPNTNNSNLVVLTLKSGKKLFLSLDNIANVQKVVSNAILNGETGNEEIHVCEIILSTIQPPTQLPPIGGTFISTTPVALGSFAYANPALPINLDGTYISGALLPSTPNITEAIANVIECNCDCWVT